MPKTGSQYRPDTRPDLRWPGLLIGRRMICAYLGGIGIDTMYRWRKRYRLPLGHLPSGELFSSTSALDAWLDLALQAEAEDGADKTGWRNGQYGAASGIRLAHQVGRLTRTK